MPEVSIEELRQRSNDLRLKVDRLFARYGMDLAVAVDSETDPEKISLDELIDKCRADAVDSASTAEVDQAAAVFLPFALSAQDDGSCTAVPSDLLKARAQIAKGRSIVESFQQQTRSLWEFELAMRAEVDALREAVGEESGAGAYAAEQKRLLLEKMLLSILIIAGLEEAKRCLLLAVEKLDQAYFLLELVSGAVLNVNRQSGEVFKRILQLNREAFQKDPTAGFNLNAADAAQLVAALKDQQTIDAGSARALAVIRELRDEAINTLLPKALGLQQLVAFFAGLEMDVQKDLAKKKPGPLGPF